MKRKKKNCWEYKQCGREPGGAQAKQLGVCPAATEKGFNGVHAGRNAGRACWVVAGTFCCSTIAGTVAREHGTCTSCNFYQLVKKEEHPDFIFSGTLLTHRIK
jgi:hypothetical protein